MNLIFDLYCICNKNASECSIDACMLKCKTCPRDNQYEEADQVSETLIMIFPVFLLASMCLCASVMSSMLKIVSIIGFSDVGSSAD